MTKEALRECAIELGFSALGVTSADASGHWDFYREWLERGFAAEMNYLHDHLELKRSVKNLLPEARSVVVVSVDYNQRVDPQPGEPKIARYALGRDYHKVIRGKLHKLAGSIASFDPTVSNRVCVDSAPILERDFAHLAGLGWFGKNTCLIDSKRGSWFLLGVLLTSHEFEPDSPSVGGCGTCTRCIDACPTGAIVLQNHRWQVDARRCISYLTIESKGDFDLELKEKLEGWTFGCDICQEVCPFNTERDSQPSRAALTTEPDFLARRTWPHLKQLAVIDEKDWDALTRSSSVRRAGLDGIRRNAQANLDKPASKNSAD